MSKKISYPQQSLDEIEALRHEAIDLYLQGVSPTAIARRLGRSRKWFYDTLHRYQQKGREGLQSRSRRPHCSPNQISPELEAAIIRGRQLLTSGKDPVLCFANFGADAIAAELRRAGIQPPSRATINRVLRRHGLSSPRPKRRQKTQLPADYPWPQFHQAHDLHVMDFMERVLPGGQRFYAANLLEVYCQWPFLKILPNKTKREVMNFFLAAWKDIGLPKALMLDNDPVWRGSSSAPYTFSGLLRLWLLLGIQIIFIPPYTPQANTWIESFNHLWNRNFWERITFQHLQDVNQHLPNFQRYCREHRPIPGKGITPVDLRSQQPPPQLLQEDFQCDPQIRLPLTEGFIHFIRFVDHQGRFSLLNASWSLDSQWAGKTIRATVSTKQRQMYIYHQPNPEQIPVCIAEFPFPIDEEVQPVPKEFRQKPLTLWPSGH